VKIKFIGTGTSHGVPVIGCSCAACMSTDPRDKRYRSSVFLTFDNGTNMVIDMPAEFRIRSLEYNIIRLDAVLFTHAHADHTSGLDDVRRYNELQNADIPVYGDKHTLADIKERFSYIFRDTQKGGGKPRLKPVTAEPGVAFDIKGVEVLPVPVKHGCMDIFAYRIGDFAYITDVSEIPEKSIEMLKGVKVLVLDALRPSPHPTHFSLSQAVDTAKKIGADAAYFTHMSHDLKHLETEAALPPGIRLAYDGLELNVKEH
jgi:phosphoribosyl 1,2-cyclic phosphate phosphodiesterase